VQVIPVSVSDACQFPQHLKNRKYLATYVRFCCWFFSLQLNYFKLFTVGYGGNQHQMKV